MRHFRSSIRRSFRGYTLIELLVVLLIASLLIATALPIAATALEDARVREASRTLNAYFAMAKSRAAGTGRPCGLVLKSQVAGSGFQSTEIYLCEVAAPYGGSTLPAPLAWLDAGKLKFSPGEDAYMQALVEDRETFTVRFGYKGDYFQFERNGADFDYQNSVLGTTSPPASPGQPFQAYRTPKLISVAREMPAGTAVDLTYSGVGSTGNELAAAGGSVMVLFASGGNLQAVEYTDASGNPTAVGSGTVHFLVGRIEKTGASGVNSNLADPTSLWVSVGAATGVVVTSENTPNDPTALNMALCRSVASNREQMGGR
jgi:prepilin-type N-terminal cleavage/methylation domain-containing protein